MTTSQITYRFFISKDDDDKVVVDLEFDETTYRMKIPSGGNRPDWAKLEFQKCPNCPLGDHVEWCPAALALAQFVPKFKNFYSYDKAVVEVETPLRTIVSKQTFQVGLGSLFGLACATSGCPRTEFLRPMARFHAPFSDERETVFRSLSTHLLQLYHENQQNGNGAQALNFDRLKEDYAQVSTVNNCLAERLQKAVERDAVLNAVIVLDTFAMITPENTDGEFVDLEDVFTT